MKPIIEVKNVSKKFIIPHEKENSLRNTLLNFYKKKTYETFYALKDVSFEINKGEFIGIIGRNGSGKSTLLKILAGIYQPESGQIIVREKISPFLELGVGFNGELSGRDNIYLYGAVLGLSRENIDSKFNEIIRFAELEKFIDMKMKNYSSGMYVRLAFSVAIQADTPILIVDEVLAVGDINFQRKCFDIFDKYKKEGKTVILVTHDLNAVETYCNKAFLIENGEIISCGQPRKVIGEYNLIFFKDNEKKREIENKKIVENTKKIMQKEENNLAKKNDKAVPNRWGTGEVKIKDILIINRLGSRKNIFKKGEDIKIRVEYVVEKDIKSPNLGVAIFRKKDDLYCYDINTHLENIKIKKLSHTGNFEIIFNNVKLLSGTYYLKVGIFGEYCKYTYDFWNKGPEFEMVAENKDHGSFYMEHTWNLKEI
jgi:lipopolysaccharide transport system ATP-binding protein